MNTSRLLFAGITLAVAVTVVGIGVAVGGPGSSGIPPSPPPDAATPVPPSPLTPGPASKQTQLPQPPLIINGREIPLPPGAQWSVGVDDSGGHYYSVTWPDPTGSHIFFNDATGITDVRTTPGDSSAYQRTIEALHGAGIPDAVPSQTEAAVQ